MIVYVAAVESARMLSLVGNEALDSIAAEVRDRLTRVVERVAQS